MSTRIEIYRDGLWRGLRLQNDNAVRYNVLINRIGKLSSREISHTNTFSLPFIHQNIEALKINFFNKLDLAKALNTKYPAKYYVEDKILQQGFLVINNTNNGTINVNFIDEALEIIEKWGSMTYNELLTSSSIQRPSDYQTVIDQMIGYSMSKTSILVPLPNVGSRGYKLATFPNSLNAIGDKFQKTSADIREGSGRFNPYQSRPIFSVKAMLDLATESFGYTPIYDSSVNWNIVAKTHIIAPGLGENQRDDGGLVNSEVLVNAGTGITYSNTSANVQTVFSYPYSNSKAQYPGVYVNWGGIPILNISSDPSLDYRQKKCLYVPDVEVSSAGTLTYSAVVVRPTGSVGPLVVNVYAVWNNVTPGQPTVNLLLTPTEYTASAKYFSTTIEKSAATATPPTGGGLFIGFLLAVRGNNQPSSVLPFSLTDQKLIETYLPSGIVSYDDYGQYIANNINLTHAAPRENLKELISACLQKEGILMSINGKLKTINFFSYGLYEMRKKSGQFIDWSKYLQKYSLIEFNTDYGSEFAKKNEIGLNNPYIGNTYNLILANQGADSKYRDYITNYISKFNDVSSIYKVNSSYFEYENQGLGLVEIGVPLGTLTQSRADGTNQGTFSGLASIYNVNYALLPKGVSEWYKLVDSAIRISAEFLLPINDIRELDLSWPVYIESLGGFYIIEEISEYSNPHEPVTVKLIKLIDGLISPLIVAPSEMAGDYQGQTSYIATLEKISNKIFEGMIIGSSSYSGSLNFDRDLIASVGGGSVYSGSMFVSRDRILGDGSYIGDSAYLGTLVSLAVDITPPTQPGNFRFVNQTGNTLNLTWDASTDNVGVVGYEIWAGIDLEDPSSNPSNDGEYMYHDFAPGLTYGFIQSAYPFPVKVRAIDAAGNRSALSTNYII